MAILPALLFGTSPRALMRAPTRGSCVAAEHGANGAISATLPPCSATGGAVMVRSMKPLKILACLLPAVLATATADPVVDAFYARCVSENAYQMGPNDLEGACACMAPLMVSFLTDEARR